MRWRLACLRGWLALMALSTANALRIVAVGWPGFLKFFPGAGSSTMHALAIALPIALLIALGGLWLARRWAVIAAAGTTVATVLFDLLARGPWLHLAAALVSSTVLALLLWWNRGRFRRQTHDGMGG